jgi:hypothetical protein
MYGNPDGGETMTRNLLLAFVLFAMALAWAASSHSVNFSKPAIVGNTEIKPGDYKLELNGNKAVLKRGKTEVEAEVTVENGATKFTQTSACCLGDDGKYRLQEIRVGGTNTKVTFKENMGMAVGK